MDKEDGAALTEQGVSTGGGGESPRERSPEILAPAGDPLALRAAIAAGADAVYLGMARFNARGRAERFRGVTLESCVRAAHEHGVRVYVTLNTLLHDDELGAALELAREAYAVGADAAIVQDLGFASLLREEIPALALHGSTQMALHQPSQAVEAARRLGLRRVIVARECSSGEVGALVQALEPLGTGVEVFVHGALCFAYSGQCLMSNFAGRRSANRGICAQNCRFDFTTTQEAGGRAVSLEGQGDLAAQGAAYAGAEAGRSQDGVPNARADDGLAFSRRRSSQLISMKDLAAFESVGLLADLGVESFKIEGRLKGPDYVAEVVRLYRAAINAWRSGSAFRAEEAERVAGRVYSRGFTNGYLRGEVTAAMRGDKRRLEGEPDAVVVSADRRGGILVLEARSGHRISPGQGYRYAHDRYRGGFRVLGVQPAPESRVRARVRFGSEASGRSHRRGAVGRRRPPPPLPEGLGCYWNHDPTVEDRTARLLAQVQLPAAQAAQRRKVTLRVEGREGEPLRAFATVGRMEAEPGQAPARQAAVGPPAEGRAANENAAEVATERVCVDATSNEPLAPARSRPLSAETLTEHLGRFGGTTYLLESLDASGLEGACFLTLSALHALRRDLTARMDEALSKLQQAPTRLDGVGPRHPSTRKSEPARRPSLAAVLPTRRRKTALAVTVSSAEAAQACFEAGVRDVIVECAAVLRGDLDALCAWPRGPLGGDHALWARLSPVVHDPAVDERALRALHAAPGNVAVLAGHLGQISQARELGLRVAADYFLNATNSRSLAALRGVGAARVALSLEMDVRDAALAAAAAPGDLEVEVIVGGRVFSMLTRQDYGLAPGQGLLAVSEHGHAYAFEARGGITWLHEGRELVGARLLGALVGKVDALRLDLAHASPLAVREIVAAYAAALASGEEADAREAARVHACHAPHGVFEGHLRRGARALDSGP